MKLSFFITCLFALLVCACTKKNDNEVKKQVEEIEITDLELYKLKVLPENPSHTDEIKLIFIQDCIYNVLSGYDRISSDISIEKHFNSSMKLPCIYRNDTLSIGKIGSGDFTFHYKLVDIANSNIPVTTLALSFKVSIP